MNNIQVNKPCNYLGSDFIVKSINPNRSVTLKSPSKHLNDVIVNQNYTKNIRSGFYVSGSRKDRV